MYKEVSFDPSCMGSMEYYCLLKQHFGYDHGRYVAVDVKAWAKEAMKTVKQSALQPVKKKSVKNYLNKLVTSRNYGEFHLAPDREGVEYTAWVSWHADQVSIRPFSFVLSESSDVDSICVDDINNGSELWCLKRSISIDRNAVDILNELMPLINISRRVTVIDQYFRLSNNPTLKELICRCQGCGVENISIITSMETPNALEIYNREYKTINENGILFSWIKAPNKFFHDRYLITDVGAIRSGQGFMPEIKKGIHADKVNLNIIGKDEVDRTLADLSKLLENKNAVEIFRI